MASESLLLFKLFVYIRDSKKGSSKAGSEAANPRCRTPAKKFCLDPLCRYGTIRAIFMKKKIDLTEGSLGRHILRMTPPMVLGFLSMVIFNISDAWFLSRLGITYLAAIGYTFPLVMIFQNIGMGIALGTASCVSRAIGKNDTDHVRHLTSYSILLAAVVLVVMSIAGQLLLRYLLEAMGAKGETFAAAQTYMRIWFCYAPFGILPMIGHNAMRATGNTLQPGLIIASGALLNLILDPLLIFGIGIFPALGMAGASIATGIARLWMLIWCFSLLYFRFNLLSFQWTGVRKMLEAWRDVLYVAAPAAATNMLMPVTNGIILRIISGFGQHAIAATTAGQRIEGIAYMIPMAMGSTLVPILGQNWGARRLDRVRGAWIRTNCYGSVYSVLCLILVFFFGRQIAGIFSHKPEVNRLIVIYLRIMLSGAIMLHMLVHSGFAFNAIGKPIHASVLTAVRLLLFVLPLAWLGSKLAGVAGIYFGNSLGHVLAGTVAILWFSGTLRKIRKNELADKQINKL